MYEKLRKCAAENGFRNSKLYSTYCTHEMKNRILSKNKGCLFFLLPKIRSTARIVHDVCLKKFSPKLGGRGGTIAPYPHVSYAYEQM